jgi:gas vesicle protein
MLMRSRLGRLMMWMGIAAAATYFFDPDLGEQRRQALRRRFQKVRDAAETTDLETTGS